MIEIFRPMWSPIVRFVSYVTGRPSWMYSKRAFYLAVGLSTSSDIAQGVEGANLWLVTLLLGLTALVAWWVHGPLTQAIEDASRRNDSTELLLSVADEHLHIWRIIFSVNVLFLSPDVIWFLTGGTPDPSGILAFADNFMYGYAVWAVHLNHPGGKSVFAKVKDKVKSLIPEFRPVLAPIPA